MVDSAIRQWVGPLVYRGLTEADCIDRIGESAARLRANAVEWTLKGSFVQDTLERALKPLTAAGIEPVVLKGAALKERYSDPSLRPLGDIDLLLPEPHHTAALQVLQDAGWRVLFPLRGLRYETTLAFDGAPTLAVEIHVRLDRWQSRLARSDSQALWRRRRGATVLGVDAFVLQPEDELLVMAQHTAKPFHCFDRMMWLADLVVAIEAARAHGGLDWDLVRRRVRETRGGTVLATALALAVRLGADPPGDLVAALPSGGWRRVVLGPLLDASWPLAEPDEVTRRRARYALSDTWSRRLILFLGESPYEPWQRQPLLLARRLRLALFGFPRLMRQSRLSRQGR